MKVLLVYKNFSKDCTVSHLGLGVTASYSAKTLRQHGYCAEALPIFGGDDLMQILQKRRPATHIVIMAQFIPTNWIARLCRAFPETKFALNCHSNIGFLQAEPNAIRLLREAIDLETGIHNFVASGNNKRFVDAMQLMFGRPLHFLPNLYHLHGFEPIHRPPYNGGTLRLGAFGSHRIYKNFSSAVAAAMILSHELKTQTELWINAGRSDGNGKIVYQTALAWTTGMPNIDLKELHWTSWPQFKRWVGSMHLLLQPSYTESFNNVTADGTAEGTPSVVSEVIDWAPEAWKADSDDATEIARVGRRLLSDHHAAREGYHHLKEYVRNGLRYWEEWFREP